MSFTAGVYYGGEMRMNLYTVSLHMTTNSHDSVSHNVAFERIKHFVYNLLDSTIFINLEYQDKCDQYMSAGLTVTTLPGEPVDQLIGLMLYYKLNAVMEERILINEVEISSMLGENMIYLHNENETTDVEFIPKWWTTPDPSHNDYILLETEKVVAMHASDPWRELNLTWQEPEPVKDTGNIVVFADFKPDDDSK